MKVNKTYKIVRPMRKFGNLIKDIFNPTQSIHFWVRVKEKTISKEEKENIIFSVIELLNNRIKIDE
jgi:hypothetical protein